MKTSTTAAIASSAMLSLVSAQYSIDPNSVSSALRNSWCNSQITQCPLICLQLTTASGEAVTTDNTCDSSDLSYSCVCGDGVAPNITEYTQTMPFFVCQEWGNQCVTGCNGDNTCSSSCRQDHPCGAQNPVRPNSSTISSTMTSSSSSRTASEAGATTDSSGGTIYSGFGGGASATGDSSSAEESSSSSSSSSQAADSGAGRAAALEFGQTFGFLALAGAFFGGFAMVL